MKIKFCITILLVLILFSVSCGWNSETKIENKKADKNMQEFSQELILKNRFINSPENPAYIIVKVKSGEEQMDLVCTSSEWMNICINSLKLVKSPEEYMDYMLKNYDRIFDVSGKLYRDLEKYRADDTYAGKYKTKEDFQKAADAGEFAGFTEQQLLKDRAFLKMMLQFVPVIRLNIRDGSIAADNSYEKYRIVEAPKNTKKVTEATLKKRFGNFSTSPAYILIKIRNSQTKEEAEIACLNGTWANICVNELKVLKPETHYKNPDDYYKSYISYMMSNYNKVFAVSPEVYAKLKGISRNSYIEPLKTNVIIVIDDIKGDVKFIDN